jgi:hypothetical protein
VAKPTRARIEQMRYPAAHLARFVGEPSRRCRFSTGSPPDGTTRSIIDVEWP